MRLMTDEQRSSRTDLNKTIDIQRARNLSELRRHVGTATGRQAVDVYRNTQVQADTARRSAVRRADDSFIAAVQRLVANRQAAQAGQVEALRITLDDALQTASGQCAAGVEAATVSRQFIATVHTSRDTYLDQRKADDTVTAQGASLSETRRQAVATANQTYNDTISQARRILQAHLVAAD
jgi:hypothetical protein